MDLTKDETVPPKQEWAMVRSNVRDFWLPVVVDATSYLRPQVPMNHSNGSTMDVDVAQDEQLSKAIAESLAMSTTVDEVDEVLPPEAWLRKDDR